MGPQVQPGDRVRLPAAEAVVDAVVPGGRVYIDGEWYDPDDLTLIDRPTPPLPTERSSDGLVERIKPSPIREIGTTWRSLTDLEARGAALAVAQWLDEQDVYYVAAADLIRREVEGAGRE